jgi:predicted transposase YdaD
VRPESSQNQESPGNPENPQNQSSQKGDGAATPKAEPPEISYDKLIKTGLRAHYGDVVEWLVKERPLEVKTLEPVQDTTVERLGDKLWEARFEDKPGLLLHVEWQLESDWKMMPVRMLQFASLVLELLSLEENKGKRFLGVVVYLDKKTFSGDPGGLVEELFPGRVLSYSYEVLKLWELDPEPVLESQSPGLWPFAPLMRGDPYDLLERSKQRIVGLPDKIMGLEHKQQLLTILAGLSYRVIKDWPFLQSVLSELGNMSENPVIDALLEMYGPAAIQRREEKAHREGRQEGAKAGARAALLRFLRRRFGEVGELVERRIEGIDDLETIERLAEEAAVAPTLDAFVAFLPSSSR